MLPNFFAHEKAKKGPHCCTQVSPGLVYHEHQIPLGHKGKIWVCFLDDHSESANTLYGCLTHNLTLGRQSCRQFAAQYATAKPDLHERLTNDAGGYDQ